MTAGSHLARRSFAITPRNLSMPHTFGLPKVWTQSSKPRTIPNPSWGAFTEVTSEQYVWIASCRVFYRGKFRVWHWFLRQIEQRVKWLGSSSAFCLFSFWDSWMNYVLKKFIVHCWPFIFLSATTCWFKKMPYLTKKNLGWNIKFIQVNFKRVLATLLRQCLFSIIQL